MVARQPAVGWMFARFMSVRWEEFGQHVEEIKSSSTPKRIAAAIARRIAALVADSSVLAATLVLPGIVTIESLLAVALELGRHPGWTVTTSKVVPPPAGNFVAVQLVREIPFGAGVCPSEALVLGPFCVFPPTRKAPVTALEIFVGDPGPKIEKTGGPTTKANLANVNLGVELSRKQIDNMMERSVKGRRESLGGDDNRAKARVSFAVRTTLARKFGCAP